jgi:hypothetical protein
VTPTQSLLLCVARIKRSDSLSDQGGGSAGLVLPGGGQLLYALVVAGKAVDAGLDQNEAELGVHVLVVALKVLAHGDGALDQAVEVLRDLGGEAVVLKDTEDLAAGDVLDLSDTHGVTELHADGAWGKTLAGKLADGRDDVAGGNLQPAWGSAAEGESRGALALAVTVHASHDCDEI